ncbi:hypothetical protein HZB05_00900 [Candidatus Wolfebacteria bacterium]|nr:hypothetical protein [Candidatus Wolfebacteria bacterium]
MGRRNIFIPLGELKRLYIDDGLTSLDLAKKLNCSDATIRNKLHKLGVKLQPGGRRKFKYKKFPFNGSGTEKAYMFGFRVGDLNVYRPNPKSKILVVRCHTTILDQVDVIKHLFGKYGMVRISESKNNSYHVNCYLDLSFEFLIKKIFIPQWAKNNKTNSLAFIAGYTDAEGSFRLNQGKGRFKIDSYDYFVLSWMYNFLQRFNINVKFRRISKKGESYGKGNWNNDLWRLNINDANSLEKFINLISPFLLHRGRIKDAKMVLKNIKQRRKNGTIR